MPKFQLFPTLIISLLLSLSFNAQAMNLQQAMQNLSSYKAQGLVGEQPNGYLGVVKNQQSAASLVDFINQARKEKFVKIAKTHQLSITKIEALAGKKAFQKTPSGQFIQLNGHWQKKP